MKPSEARNSHHLEKIGKNYDFQNLIDISKLFTGCKSREVKSHHFIVSNRN